MTTKPKGRRPIREGSWVRCKLPGHRKFLSTVRRVREDGTVDVIDTRGAVRTVRPDLVEPANRPKVVPAYLRSVR